MNVTIVEAARSSGLTTLARLKGELGIASSDTSQDERLENMIEEVSAAVLSYCHGSLSPRQSVTERQAGSGRTVQVLSITPIVSLLAARLEGDAIAGDLLSVTDPAAGFVMAAGGFLNTSPSDRGIISEAANQPGRQSYAFDYIGGYVLPGDDISASGTCNALASDHSFNLTGDTFPILVSGEYVRVAGFSTAGNNGRHKVLSREEQKLIVASTLVDEAPSGIVTIRSRTFPRDVEAWVISELRDRYLTAARPGASDMTSERIGDWGATYATPGGRPTYGLSAKTAAGLESWVRVE